MVSLWYLCVSFVKSYASLFITRSTVSSTHSQANSLTRFTGCKRCENQGVTFFSHLASAFRSHPEAYLKA